MNGRRWIFVKKSSNRIGSIDFFQFLILSFGLLFGSVLTAAQPRPNVLFIAIDDLRPSLGCYGDPLVQSPHIDRLARSSRVFRRAYCNQAVCGPSRASSLTGRLPGNIHVWHNRNLFRQSSPDAITLPQWFMNHGYHTQSLGKIFSGDEREEDPASWSVAATQRLEGWRNYVDRSEGKGKGVSHEAADVPDDGYTDGKLADLAVKTLSELKASDQPFFLAVGFYKPHLPFNAPKRYWDLYHPSQFALDNQPDGVIDAPAEAYHSHRELGGYRDIADDERVTPEQATTLRHGYHACVSYVDAQVGKLIDALDALHLADDTIVVLWGDHGFALGENNRWCKGTNFELDTHVPLIIRAPGMPHPGASTDALIEMVDLYPTLSELAHLPAPMGLDGRSVTAAMMDPAASGRDLALSQFARPFKPTDPEVMGYSIRSQSERYTRWIDWATSQTIAEELYDYSAGHAAARESDRWIERANLAGAPASAAKLELFRGQMDDVLSKRLRPRAPAVLRGDGRPGKKGSAFLKKQVLFVEGSDGFKLYRIPGIVVTAAGTVLAYCEARKHSVADRGESEIHLRRSVDGGITWSPPASVAHHGPRLSRNPHMSDSKLQKDMGGAEEQTVNNPVAIAERDGSVHLIYCVEYMRCFHIRSHDDGLTWSHPIEITEAFERFRDEIDWQVIATGPGHGIQLSGGRLVVPFWMATYEKVASPRKAAAVIYSDDGGECWRSGEIAIALGGESNVAELSDGSVLLTARNTDTRDRRLAAVSADGATGWSNPVIVEDLLEPGCMAGLARHPGGGGFARPALLFSNPPTTDREHQARRDLTIRVSHDDGRTWPSARRIENGPSAYSDLAVLADGTVLCFYESGGQRQVTQRKRPWAYSSLTLARFNAAWLSEEDESKR